MEVIAIAAVARNGVIGASGDIPWSLPEDWRRFKRVTTGHVVVMGRTTFEGIGLPLPGRISVVVTHARDWSPRDAPGAAAPGRWRFDDTTEVVRAGSVTEALALARHLAPERICWVAGGGAIYREAMPFLTGLDITEVPLEPEGDTSFPEINPERWRVVRRKQFPGFTVVRYAPAQPGVPHPGPDAEVLAPAGE